MRVIAGSAKGRILKSPRSRQVRPTSDRVKEAFFNMVSDFIINARFLDLFAGTGSIGIEALSRGAGSCVFVEKERHCAELITANLHLTGLHSLAEILRGDIFSVLESLSQRGDCYDIIYIDPPYAFKNTTAVLSSIAERGLTRKEGIIALERDSRRRDNALEEAPFRLWQSRVYGGTQLFLFMG